LFVFVLSLFFSYALYLVSALVLI